MSLFSILEYVALNGVFMLWHGKYRSFRCISFLPSWCLSSKREGNCVHLFLLPSLDTDTLRLKQELAVIEVFDVIANELHASSLELSIQYHRYREVAIL